MSKYSRSKGARGERKVAEALRELGIEARRGQQFSGLEGKDVVSVLPWHIESKFVEALNLGKAYDQALADAKDDEVPVVVHKKNRKPMLVTLELTNFERAAITWLKTRGYKIESSSL